ncbi:hypothetical protein GE061_019930 [Apolygus lucorum]|uniref:Ubiquitin-like protein 5 n=1 Tax=Apolygus lucorum TaxID=248454 RepID=A0A6A4JRR6_APOLU|nr:hypothetical protein GE061_019930 [Apolygus lucorum]
MCIGASVAETLQTSEYLTHYLVLILHHAGSYKLIAAQTGTRWEKIVLKKWYTIFKDHIQLQDYEIHDGMNLELYYQ